MKILSVLLCCLLLAGCAPRPAETVPATVPPETAAPTSAATAAPTVPPETAPQKDAIDLAIEDMSLEQRVGQLFLARCNKDTVLTDLSQYHLGGLVLFGEDFEGQTPETMTKLLTSYQAAADYPLLLAVDEEGGDVTRISRNSAFRDKRFSSLRARWNRGGLEAVLSEEEEKCQLLAGLGINVNLGPVCDIATDPSAFLYNRSLGQDAETTAQVISSIVSLMNQEHIGSVLKHFPGYGNNADTHTGIALDSRSLSELEENDLLPFAAGIQAGCGAVMVGHVIVEAMDDSLPASLSPAVHDYLRDTMGFTGVIMTDDLVMQAITDQYGAGEAAVMA
ncbi:MAG TPA: beta-hexosaminidase, partial [Clostridiales bacterium]|nr:beta-hexosaminidase [Clostridiales bacterium]